MLCLSWCQASKSLSYSVFWLLYMRCIMGMWWKCFQSIISTSPLQDATAMQVSYHCKRTAYKHTCRQQRGQHRGKGSECPFREKQSGKKNHGKLEKLWFKKWESGPKFLKEGKNLEGLFTLPQLTGRAGYANVCRDSRLIGLYIYALEIDSLSMGALCDLKFCRLRLSRPYCNFSGLKPSAGLLAARNLHTCLLHYCGLWGQFCTIALNNDITKYRRKLLALLINCNRCYFL